MKKARTLGGRPSQQGKGDGETKGGETCARSLSYHYIFGTQHEGHAGVHTHASCALTGGMLWGGLNSASHPTFVYFCFSVSRG